MLPLAYTVFVIHGAFKINGKRYVKKMVVGLQYFEYRTT